MDFLVAQIAVWLLLAALLGGLVGWLVRGAGRSDGAALADAHRRVADLERQLATSRAARPLGTAAADARTVQPGDATGGSPADADTPPAR